MLGLFFQFELLICNYLYININLKIQIYFKDTQNIFNSLEKKTQMPINEILESGLLINDLLFFYMNPQEMPSRSSVPSSARFLAAARWLLCSLVAFKLCPLFPENGD